MACVSVFISLDAFVLLSFQYVCFFKKFLWDFLFLFIFLLVGQFGGIFYEIIY